MIRVYDYRCEGGHVNEVFTFEAPPTLPCFVCGKVSLRQLAAPRARLEGTTGSFPGAAGMWERTRAEHQRLEQKRERDHGDDGWR